MLLEARDLRKAYATTRGRIAAVDGLDLDVQAGEFLAVCGPSGSGKSTLLGLLGGLCRPSAGTVRVEGVDLGSLGPGALAVFRARHLGYLFQFAGLLPNLRAIENVALPALLGGAGRADGYGRARDLLAQVGLGDRWDAHPGELSGGEQRRVALARALVNRPALLLADEPTNDLDEQAEREVLRLLRELPQAHGTTVVVVSHDPELTRQADRVIGMRGGKVVSTAMPKPVAVEQLPAGPSWPAPDPAEPALALSPAEPTPPGAGLGRFLVGFGGWVLLAVCLLWGIDYAAARFQRQAIADRKADRKKSEELALQQLRADLDNVTCRPDGTYEVGVYLQNFAAPKPLHVLGPAVRVFVQVDRGWQELPARPEGFAEGAVHEVTGKQVFSFTFRADLRRYDELLRGYLHVRFSNVMVVSAGAEPGDDIFQRTDDYYVYLKPPNVSEDEVRKRNGWGAKAVVPRWIGMPAH